MIGPYDLSASTGLTGQFDHPDFLNVVGKIEQKTVEHNVPKGFHIVTSDSAALQKKIDEGYRFIAYGIDAVNAAVKGVDVVYNFAGIADIGEAGGKPLETATYNFLGNVHVLEAL